MKSCCKKNDESPTGSEHSQLPDESSIYDDTQEAMTLDREIRQDCERIMDFRPSAVPYLWYPSLQNVKQIDYVRRLECDFEALQTAFFTLTTHFARLQFRLRQIMTAPPAERDDLFADMEKIAFGSLDDCQVSDELPHVQHDHRAMGDVRRKQAMICEHLRSQLEALSEASEIEGMEIIDIGKVNFEECEGDDDEAGSGENEYSYESDAEDTNYGRQRKHKADGEYGGDSDYSDKNYGRRPMDKAVAASKMTNTGASLRGEDDVGDVDYRRRRQRRRR